MSRRVLHLIKGLGPGGAEQLLVNQARAGHVEDVDFVVAYLVPWKNHLQDDLTQAGWRVHCFESDRAWDLRWLYRLRKMLVTNGVDIVHGHSPLVAAFTRLVSATIPHAKRPRLMYTEHNEWGRHRPWTRRLNRWTIRREDHVLAVSNAVRDSMPESLDVEVLIHGIDVDLVQAQSVHRGAVRSELGLAGDDIVIGIVANFRKEKAYDVLLDAAAQVRAENPKLRFVSVGQGPLEAEVRAQHQRLGLGAGFQILGYRDDATRIMSAFDIFTLSSHHEGLPVALMEALALGLPVVATTVGGVPAALAGTSAVLVPAGDSDALAAGYVRMSSQLLEAPVLGTPPDQIRFDASAAADALAEHYRALSER